MIPARFFYIFVAEIKEKNYELRFTNYENSCLIDHFATILQGNCRGRTCVSSRGENWKINNKSIFQNNKDETKELSKH